MRVLAALVSLAMPLWLYPLPLASGPVPVVTQDIVPRVFAGARSGSGVSVNGFVFTARHVVKSNSSTQVVFGSVETRAAVVCVSDESVDFASMHPEKSPAVSAEVRLEEPHVGEVVVVAGYPSGFWTVSQTVVRSISRFVIPGEVNVRRAIIADWNVPRAAGGISGGGMFDVQGRLIGIVCCWQDVRGFRQVAAIPVGEGMRACSLR